MARTIFVAGRFVSYSCQILDSGEALQILENGLDEEQYDFTDGGETGLKEASIMDGDKVIEPIDFENIDAPKIHSVTDKWCLLKVEEGEIAYKAFVSSNDFKRELLNIHPYIDAVSGLKINYITLDYNGEDLEVDFQSYSSTEVMLIDDQGGVYKFDAADDEDSDESEVDSLGEGVVDA